MSRGAKIGFGIVAFVAAGLLTLVLMARAARQPETGSVLEIRLEGSIPEQAATDAITRLLEGREVTLIDHLDLLRRARDDRRINGLLLVIDGPDIGFAKAQELRDAILDFQSGGKWAVAFLETAGEFSPGNQDYYLATACGSIWMAPPGDVFLTGLRGEAVFVRGTLDLLGIYPDYDHIGKYKTFKNLFTDTAMTPAYRESMDAIIGSFFDQMVAGIAAGRKLTEPEVRTLIDGGPYIGPRALEAKLIDGLAYRDQVEDQLREKNGGRLPFVKPLRYLNAGRFYARGPRVAVIYGIGGVARGSSDDDAFTGGATLGSDTIARAIREAREDGSIQAIVFRVDSPGGSYVASDIIWREVKRTRGVKPIVVSMGDVAASGGYFVSMAADRIVAEPGTLTASIGVVAGKFVTKGFWSKIGVTWDGVQRGRNATFFSGEQKWSVEERLRFQDWLDRIYKDFVGKVAEGRGKTPEEIHAIAQGRVWSGKDAMALGLVDEMGGLTTAIRAALLLAKQDPDGPARLVPMPAKKGLLVRFFDTDDETRGAAARIRERVRRFVTEGPVPPGEQVLRLPFIPVIR